jgi:hypothetical protein
MRESSWKEEIAFHIFFALASIDKLMTILTLVKDVLPRAQRLEAVVASHFINHVERSLSEVSKLRERLKEIFRVLAPQGISTISTGEEPVAEGEIGGKGKVINWQDVDWGKTIVDNPDWGQLQRLLPKLDDIMSAMNSLMDVEEFMENLPVPYKPDPPFADYFSDTVFESLNQILSIIRRKGETVPRREGIRGDFLGARQEKGLPPRRYEGDFNTLKGEVLRFFEESQEIIEKYLSEMEEAKPINLGALKSLFANAVMEGNWEEIKSLWGKFDEFGELVLKHLEKRLRGTQLTAQQRDALETDRENLLNSLHRLAEAVGALGLTIEKEIAFWRLILLRRLIR